MTGAPREPVLLVTAGGLARETLAALRLSDDVEPVGFLDDSADLVGRVRAGIPVVGPLAALSEHPGASIVVCAGKGAVRRQLVQRLTEAGVEPQRYRTVVHPGAHLDRGTVVGRGSVVLAGVVATADVRLGEHVVVMPQVTLTHDNVVEDFATLCGGVTLGGGVTVQQGAYLGMSAAVREGVTVGPSAVLGMGAVLLSDLPAGQTWIGVPARPVSGRSTS